MLVLTRNDLERLFYRVTCLCLGVEPADQAAQSRVRISWPVDGGSNPGWSRNENICFLRISPYRDPYTRQRERSYEPQPDGALKETVNYTRCHQVYFICYGPSAMEDADTIRNNILQPDIREHLRTEYVIFPIPHIDEPVRVDELINGEWWGRCDVNVQFYEAASREYVAASLEQIPEIIMVKEDNT